MSSGQLLGEFELVCPIAVGRDAVVWNARRSGAEVAVKVVRDDTDDALARARLAHEAAVLTRLGKWGLSVEGSGSTGSALWLATHWCDSGNLASWAARAGGLADGILVSVFGRIASALAAAHELGVVHRDVKPSNIFLESTGAVWLGDFGSAAMDGVVYDSWATGGSHARLVARTGWYAAPEVMTSGSTDPPVDVFALGRSIDSMRSSAHADDWLAELTRLCTHDDPNARPTMADVAGCLTQRSRERLAPPVSVPRAVTQPVVTRSAVASRVAELASIVSTFEGCVAALETQVVLLVGPPGCGKTWLAERALSELPSGTSVSRLRCSVSIADWRVFRPLVERQSRRSLVGALGEAPLDALEQAVGLGALNAVSDLATATSALRELLRFIAPFAIVIDDLHHSDPTLREVIANFANANAAGLVLATARTGEVDADELDAMTLLVADLDDDTLRTIAATVLDDPASVDAAVRIAAGNPLHVLEAARAIARGSIDVEAATIRELIAARARAMHGDSAGALSLAAACGESCWPTVVGPPLADLMPTLVRDGWLEAALPSEFATSAEFRFLHPLLREVVYERLESATRRDLHGMLGERFKQLANPPVGAIADHLVAAVELGNTHQASDAVCYAASAGRQALDRWALADAERRIHQLRRTGPGDERTIDLLSAEIALRRGDFATAVDLVRPLEGADAAMIGCEALAALGDHAGAVELGDNVAGKALSQSIEFVLAYSESLAGVDRRRDAIDFLRSAENALREVGAAIAAARVRAARGFHESVLVMREGGEDLLQPLADGLAALDEMRALHDDHGIIVSGINLSHLVSSVDIESAVALLTDVALAARRLGASAQLGSALGYLAWLAVDAGDRDLADSAMAEARGIALDREAADRMRIVELTLGLACGDRSSEHVICGLAASVTGQTQASEGLRVLGRAAPLWLGHVAVAQTMTGNLPEVNIVMLSLVERALAGPPWELPAIDAAWGTAFHNELALLAMLAGEDDRASRLLRERHAFLVSTGSTYQRFNAYFPGALVTALGPMDIEPALEWLVGWILESAFPWMWAVHRCICATLLAERGHPEARTMVDASLRLLDDVRPDPQVRAWLEPRLRLACRRGE